MKAVDAVGQGKPAIEVARFGVIKIDKAVGAEIGMQGDAEQAFLGAIGHFQVKHVLGRQIAALEQAHLAGVLFEHKRIAVGHEGQPGRGIEVADDVIDGQSGVVDGLGAGSLRKKSEEENRRRQVSHRGPQLGRASPKRIVSERPVVRH